VVVGNAYQDCLCFLRNIIHLNHTLLPV